MKIIDCAIGSCRVLLAMLALSPFCVMARERLVIYTSMKDSIVIELKTAFTKKYPKIKVKVQLAGAGKLLAKINAERSRGKILADVLWTSEVADLYQLKAAGVFYRYIPADMDKLINPLPGYDGSFTAVKLGTLGIAYNTDLIAEPPETWNDLLEPRFKNGFGMANPSLSGTAYMSVAMLSEALGWSYFEKLRNNGSRMGKGSNHVVEETAQGVLSACLAVDYVALDMMAQGARIALVYPPEMLVIPSPVGIFNDSRNKKEAKKFIDFLLSREGQNIIANAGTLPVRADIAIPEHFALPATDEAVRRAINIDYKTVVTEKEKILANFFRIMRQ